MTLSSDAIRWSIDSINRHSDGDLSPFLPEISAIASDPGNLVKALANKPLTQFAPQPNRRFIVPKEGLSYRQATQLHPQDSILLTAAVYQFGQGIEQRRQPKDTVFSYRFNPVSAVRGMCGLGNWGTAPCTGGHMDGHHLSLTHAPPSSHASPPNYVIRRTEEEGIHYTMRRR